MSEQEFLESEEMQNLHTDLETVKELNVNCEVDLSNQIDDYDELVDDYKRLGYTDKEAKIAAEEVLKCDNM